MNQVVTSELYGSIITGYLFVLTSSLMTILHMGPLALIVPIVGIIVVTRNISANLDVISRTHFGFQRRNMLLLLLVMGGIYAWLVVEVMGIKITASQTVGIRFIEESMSDGQGLSLLKAISQHWLLHTAVSLILGLFITIQAIRGILFYSDKKTM